MHLSLATAGAVLLIAATISCADTAALPAAPRDSGASDASMAGGPDSSAKPAAMISEQPYPSAEPAVMEHCVAENSAEARAVRMLPEAPPGVVLLHQIGGGCESIGEVQVLLHNAADEPVRIDSLRTTDQEFSVTATGIPLELQPGERLPIELTFLPSSAGEFKTTLIVTSSRGCTTFPIRGIAPDVTQDSVITFSPYVLDFGHVLAGHMSTARDVVVLYQAGKSTTGPVTFGGFGVDSNAFEVVSAPGETNFQGCAKRTVSVRFAAPTGPALVRGNLFWSITGTTVTGQTLDAVGSIGLIGNADAL
jgi:hypothetical protein